MVQTYRQLRLDLSAALAEFLDPSEAHAESIRWFEEGLNLSRSWMAAHGSELAPGSARVMNAAEYACIFVRPPRERLAAAELEASVHDLELTDGKITVRGMPDKGITLATIGKKGNLYMSKTPPVLGKANPAFTQQAPGFAAQLARLEVDPDTGEVTIQDFVTVQDVGKAINPLGVEGQMQGGAVQSLGIALTEGLMYDESGRLMNASLLDYRKLTAADLGGAVHTGSRRMPARRGTMTDIPDPIRHADLSLAEEPYMQERIAVIGLGYVGLPVALAFARKVPGTVGFDVNKEKVEELHQKTNGWVDSLKGMKGELVTAGASLVQIYTGLVYEGPGIAQAIVRGLHQELQRAGLKSLTHAVGIAAR